MGQKQDEIEIKRQQASGMSPEDINKQTQQLSRDLGEKELVQGRAAVENTKRRLAGLKQDEGLPGVGPLADFREKLGRVPVVGLSPEERVSRSDWDKMRLAYQVQITGSGGSEEQMKQISSAFQGARTPAEQRNTVAQVDDFFARMEAAKKAGYDPRIVKLYEQRKEGIQPSMPSSVRVVK